MSKGKRIKVRSAIIDPKRATTITLGKSDAAIVWNGEEEGFGFYLSNEGEDDTTPMHSAVAILTMAFIHIHNHPEMLLGQFAEAVDKLDEKETKKTKH